MGANSKISWTTHTFSPWWGCQRVSPGCENCYAETFSKRLGKALWGPAAPRQIASDSYWRQPLKWNAAAAAGEHPRVFCASMADVFEDRRDLDAPRERLWALIEATPHLDWMLLTKRPENMTRLAPVRWDNGWPKHIWAGCTVEDQARAETRIPVLLDVPARVRFLSCEPLLGPVVLPAGVLGCVGHLAESFGNSLIHMVIAGAESGHGARPMNEDWVRSMRDTCVAAGVAFFYKQRIDNGRKVELPLLDGRQWAEFPAPEPRP